MKTFKYLGKVSAENFLSRFTIRFSQPKSFNDPFELLPEFYVSNSSKAEIVENSKFVLNGAESVVERYLMSNEAVAAGLSVNRGTVKMSGFNDQVGILCLTQAKTLLPANFLMWAHYSESHQGIAIEFKKGHQFISTAKNVHYQNKRPIIDSRIFDENEYIAIDDLYFKSDDWGYENEVRIAKRLDTLKALDAKDVFGYQIFVESVPVNSIEWIYLGCNASDALKSAAIKAHKEKGVKVMFLKVHDQEYKLVPYTQLGGDLSEAYSLSEQLIFDRTKI